MLTIWTEHLKDDKEKENFRRTVDNARPVLKRLCDILDKQESTLNKNEIDAATYETPSWAYLQAHRNGFRERGYLIKQLVDLDH